MIFCSNFYTGVIEFSLSELRSVYDTVHNSVLRII